MRLRRGFVGLFITLGAVLGVASCTAAPAPSANVLLHVNSTCEAMASKTGSTWSIRMTRSGSRCGLRMGAAAYRYGLPVGSISSRLDRDFDLHAYGSGYCTTVFFNNVQYKWMSTTRPCRA